MNKLCFGCGILKDISHFYKNSAMLDGYINKCKLCVKIDHQNRLNKIYSDPLLKEEHNKKIRQRRKIAGYKQKPKTKEKIKSYRFTYNKKYPEKAKANRAARDIKKEPGCNNHHWSYKIDYWTDVISLKIEDHTFVHRYIKYDSVEMCYRSHSGELLNSKELHLNYITEI